MYLERVLENLAHFLELKKLTTLCDKENIFYLKFLLAPYSIKVGIKESTVEIPSLTISDDNSPSSQDSFSNGWDMTNKNM